MSENGEFAPGAETAIEKLERQTHRVAELLTALAPELAEEFDATGLMEHVRAERMDDEIARMAVYQAAHELWIVHDCPDVLDPDALLTEAGILEPEQ